MTKLDVKKITQSRLDLNQYYQVEHPKTQIYLHHTAGNGDAVGVARYFNATPIKVATAFIIGESGEIVQCYSSKHWAYHLGLKQSIFTKYKVPYKQLDQLSIGIEITNWGPITKKNNKFFNYVFREVDQKNVIELNTPYKGHKFWYKYTPEQIESTRQLLVYLCETYNIPKNYSFEIFDICPKALKGEAGIFTHNSVRTDKSDIYPCPKMIKMLENL
jgi:N-acetyl-anhydromuramyl-L-alanine amidase AmpD